MKYSARFVEEGGLVTYVYSTGTNMAYLKFPTKTKDEVETLIDNCEIMELLERAEIEVIIL